MKRRTAALIPVIAGVVLVVAACGPSHGSHTAAEQSAKARASALATSSSAQQAKTDAKALLRACPPPQGASQLSQAAWTTWARCAGVPKAAWKPAAGCVLTAVEHGGKFPAGKQARETALINDAYPCVQKYHGGVK